MNDSDTLHEKMLAMNEALLLGSLRQHELTEASENLNAQLRVEIAERKLAEMALSNLAAIVEFSSDAIISKDMNGTITSWNKSAEAIFGYTSGEMVGTSILRLIPDDRQDEEHQILAKIRDGKIVEHFETQRKTRDGRLIDLSVTISPIKDATGRVIGASKVAHDITERKRVKEAQQRIAVLAASNQKLELEIIRREGVEKTLMESEQHQKQMRERAKQLAHQVLHSQEEERLRISRELHDQVVQTLIGISVRLVALNKEAEALGPDFQQRLTLAQDLVENSVETVHQFSRDLRPTLLDDLGLIPTLHAFLKIFMKDTGIRTTLTVFSGVEKLDSTLLTVLYRVAQEALTNVSRHAKADTVEVGIQKLENRICMTIKDNGEGFKGDPIRRAKGGKRLGLIGMQERLEMIGGTFDIQSVKDQGTTVTAQIPLDDLER